MPVSAPEKTTALGKANMLYYIIIIILLDDFKLLLARLKALEQRKWHFAIYLLYYPFKVIILLIKIKFYFIYYYFINY